MHENIDKHFSSNWNKTETFFRKLCLGRLFLMEEVISSENTLGPGVTQCEKRTEVNPYLSEIIWTARKQRYHFTS